MKEMKEIAGEEIHLNQRQHPFLKKTLQTKILRTSNSPNSNKNNANSYSNGNSNGNGNVVKLGSKSERTNNGMMKNKDNAAAATAIVHSMSMKVHDVDSSNQFSIFPAVDSNVRYTEDPFAHGAEKPKLYNSISMNNNNNHNSNNNNIYTNNYNNTKNNNINNNNNKNDDYSNPLSYIEQSKLNVIAVYGSGSKSSKIKDNDKYKTINSPGDEEMKKGTNKISDVTAIQKRVSPTDGPETQHSFDIRKSPEKRRKKSIDKNNTSNIGFSTTAWKAKFDHFHDINEFTDLNVLKLALNELKKLCSLRKNILQVSPGKESKISRINKSRVPQSSSTTSINNNNDGNTSDNGNNDKQEKYATIEYFAILVDNNVSVEKSMEKLRNRDYVSEIHHLCQNSPINVESYYSAIWGDKIPF